MKLAFNRRGAALSASTIAAVVLLLGAGGYLTYSNIFGCPLSCSVSEDAATTPVAATTHTDGDCAGCALCAESTKLVAAEAEAKSCCGSCDGDTQTQLVAAEGEKACGGCEGACGGAVTQTVAAEGEKACCGGCAEKAAEKAECCGGCESKTEVEAGAQLVSAEKADGEAKACGGCEGACSEKKAEKKD